MKNFKLSFLALSIIIALTSCEGLFNGSVLEVDLPEHESQLAPYAFFKDTDSILTVMVGKSVGVLDSINPDVVYGANVELYKNGVWEYTFTYTDSIRGYQVILDEPFNPTVGDEYELRVSADGFEMTTATQIVPEKVQIIESDVELTGSVDQFGDPVDIIEIKFKDPEGIRNYYTFSGFMEIRFQSPFDSTIIEEYRNSFDFESNDPNYTTGYITNGTLSDLTFDGKEYLLRLNSYNWLNLDGVDVEISGKVFLHSITLEYANYLNSLNAYTRSKNNPFSEPVLLYSNMSGGLGAFGLCNSTTSEF